MKKREGLIKNCVACKKEFYVPLYRKEIAKFCSKKCQNHAQYDKYKFHCACCGKEVITSPSKRRQRKRFCSMECKTFNSYTEKTRRAQSRAYNKLFRNRKISQRTLRRSIFLVKEIKCEKCGYMEFDFCLDIHHKDGNCTNNSLENIAILCAFCHRKVHKGIILF